MTDPSTVGALVASVLSVAADAALKGAVSEGIKDAYSLLKAKVSHWAAVDAEALEKTPNSVHRQAIIAEIVDGQPAADQRALLMLAQELTRRLQENVVGLDVGRLRDVETHLKKINATSGTGARIEEASGGRIIVDEINVGVSVSKKKATAATTTSNAVPGIGLQLNNSHIGTFVHGNDISANRRYVSEAIREKVNGFDIEFLILECREVLPSFAGEYADDPFRLVHGPFPIGPAVEDQVERTIMDATRIGDFIGSFIPFLRNDEFIEVANIKREVDRLKLVGRMLSAIPSGLADHLDRGGKLDQEQLLHQIARISELSKEMGVALLEIKRLANILANRIC